MRRSYLKNTAPYDAILALIVALVVLLFSSLCSAQITLTAYGGGTGSQTAVLATGWNTVALTMTAANMAPDANGDFVRLSGSNIYFTEAVVDQN